MSAISTKDMDLIEQGGDQEKLKAPGIIGYELQ